MSEKLTFPIISFQPTLSFMDIDRPVAVRPAIKEIEIPENKKPANIPTIKPTVLNYHSMNGSRGQFNDSDYDMDIINRVEDTDSYVHQTFVKKIGLMFKEGYELVGANPQTIQYIKLRMTQMSRATGIPTEELLRTIGSSLVKKSNAFLVKARKAEASGGKERTVPGTNKTLRPIAGYFPVAAETMRYECDNFGRIKRWKQELPDGRFIIFKPEDVIHIYFNKKDGLIFGTPTLVPVIDDIRSLRKIEENIELLVYQHLFPLFHYKVGTDEFPATIDETGTSEIDAARTEIRLMPSEGGLVTSHRHEITLIGAENRSLRAEGYLEHFKKRVFSGLGISGVDMGEGECYSEDTQTLTENGWKYHWQIDHRTEKIATFNPLYNRIEFHLANYKHESKYTGKMIRFHEPWFYDILVSPEHDMYVEAFNQKIGLWGKAKATDLLNKERLNCNMRISAPLGETEEFIDMGYENLEEFCYLAGILITHATRVENEILVTFDVKNKLAKRFSHVLSEMGIEFEVSNFKEGKCMLANRMQYRFSADVFNRTLLPFINNSFSELIDLLPQVPFFLRKHLAGGIVDATGSYKKKVIMNHYGVVPFFEVHNKKQDILDKVGLVCMSAGFQSREVTSNKGKFSLSILCRVDPKHTKRIKNENVSEVNYSGTIYCYNVPNHLFFTRRNGLTTIQGNTANRATSDSMSRNLVDSVKDFQRVLESQFTSFLIDELLQEGTFGSDCLNEENKVLLKFKEIDVDHQIKKETHLADQFAKNVISQHEARMGMGRQPMRIPTADEIENDPDIHLQYPEWHATFWKLIDEPKTLMQAIDEPYTAAAKAAAASASTSLTAGQAEEAGQQQTEHEVELEKEKGKAKIAIAKMKPKPKAKDFLQKYWMGIEEEIVHSSEIGTYSDNWSAQKVFLQTNEMIKELNRNTTMAFAQGYRAADTNFQKQIDESMLNRSAIESRNNFYINRIATQTISSLERAHIADLQKDDRIQTIKATFSIFKSRVSSIESYEVVRSFNMGLLIGAKNSGKSKWRLGIHHDSCDQCKAAATQTFDIATTLSEDTIPPYHPHSRSTIQIL